jgi:hypothetical protein
LLAAINDHLVMVAVAVAIPILYNNGVTVAVFVSVTNYGTITVAVPIMSGANCYANRPNANADFFGARRHRGVNGCDGGNY